MKPINADEFADGRSGLIARVRRLGFPLLWVLMGLAPAAAGSEAFPATYDYSALNETAIQDGGRKKPYHTFCVETLQSLSGRSYFVHSVYGKIGPVATITSLWLNPDAWTGQPIILLNNKTLKENLGLPIEQKRFSYETLASNAPFRQLMSRVMSLRDAPGEAQLTPLQKEVENVAMRLLRFEGLTTGSLMTFVPNPDKNDGRWATPDTAIATYANNDAGRKVSDSSAVMREAFRTARPDVFAGAAEEFSANLRRLKPEFYPSQSILKLEHFYQNLHPFRWAWILYLAGAIVLMLTSLAARRIGYGLGWCLVIGGFAMQVLGFVCRILIGGRAPVTNMYETVIWVAFGCVLFALILEAIYRCRYFLLAATPAAVLSLILADTQGSILDSSINPLVPVLRDNFWLSTHVTSITLSYAAFMLALGVGHIILGKVILGLAVSTGLYGYLYRTLQIGVLLLAIGTVLGGVWANYSWGRFWDWDPKETWALITLLCYLALLHGRIAGWWNGFGLAVGSIAGFLSVLMAWYGVNFVLGQGLHSYGFGAGGFQYVAGFCAAELLFAGTAILRHRNAAGSARLPAESGAIKLADSR